MIMILWKSRALNRSVLWNFRRSMSTKVIGRIMSEMVEESNNGVTDPFTRATGERMWLMAMED